MVDLFEYILVALACPLVLPMIKSQESEISDKRGDKQDERCTMRCSLCDQDKCCRGTDKCDAEIWAKGKKEK